MQIKKPLIAILIFLLFFACKEKAEPIEETVIVNDSISQVISTVPFVWEGANIYFLLIYRFNNGNTANDINYDRTDSTGALSGFMGGDIEGITKKIKEGYFSELGINAIWFTPAIEQIHGSADEDTGNTYGCHGYWAKDWTALDSNFGTKKDLKENPMLSAEPISMMILKTE